MTINPTLKTYEEFIFFYEKDTEDTKRELWKQYQFAMKERDRLREKDKRRQEKRKAIRDALPPEQRPKPGRPRKNPPISS